MLKRFHTKGKLEAGCDEAGRGCLAGPVFAAAVILPDNFRAIGLNDSKQLSEKERFRLRKSIEKKALSWAVAKVDHGEIDEINILNASFLAMHRAIDQLRIQPEQLLIDGNRFNRYKEIPHHCIVEGDSKYHAIAAASILAKTYRDEYMISLHTKFPNYGWDSNMGYPTRQHRKGIELYGTTPFHRLSFRLLPDQVKGDTALKREPVST